MAQMCGGGIGGLGDAFGGCGLYVDAIAVIVLRGCTNVPAVDAFTGPGAADSLDFIDKDSSVGWCKGQAIEIVGAVELGFGGNARVNARRPEKIECGYHLLNEAATQMDGKIGVNAGQARKEMTFPCVDSFFGGVSAMDVVRRKLVVKRDGFYVVCEAKGTFVVYDF